MQVSHSFFNVIQQYFAGCVLLPVFIVALVWIVHKWKPEYRKRIVVMICGSILVFNELVYRVFVVVGEGSTYYRLIWIVPIAFVISVFVVEQVTVMTKVNQVLVLCISLLVIFMFSKQSGEEWLTIPTNVYQVDEDVVQVADKLMEITDGEPTYLLDNGNLYEEIRQYDARIMYTDMEEVGLWAIIEGESDKVLGRDLIEVIWDDRSRYLALRKDNSFIHKLVESAGLTLAGDTDNYSLYYVDYEELYWDWVTNRKLMAGLIEQATTEYISIAGLNGKFGYVYISNFGVLENEEMYQEMFEKIKLQQPQGVIINNQLARNADWYLQYEDLFEEMQIPYYCNNQEFQVIEQTEFNICMMDNVDGISDESFEKLKVLVEEGEPIVLVLSSKVENDGKLYSFIAEAESVVQVLTAQKSEYTKELLGEHKLQYAIPVDENHIFTMLYIKGLEGKNE